jgi:pimeloyl-ACP methyl ester carboxylesterase
MRPLALLCVALFAASIAAQEEEGTAAREVRSLPAADGRAAGHLYVPEAFPAGKGAVLVALPDEATPAEAFLGTLRPLADEGGLALFCPEPADLRFTMSDLAPVLAAVEGVRAELGAGPCFLFGIDDSALTALRFAFERPKAFRGVIALGSDVPPVKPARGSEGLLVLVMKAAGDRAEAAREGLLAIGDSFEFAEFRTVPGGGRTLDPAARIAVMDLFARALGRARSAGRDQSLPWRAPAAGLAERAQKKLPALIYFFDEAPAFAAKTERIEREVLGDPRLRRGGGKFVPILAPREEAAKLSPDAKLAPGPALVVLDAEGRLAGVQQQKLGAVPTLLGLR